MGFVEGSLRAMQNSHEVDDCIMSRQGRCQGRLVVHIELQDRQPWQMLQMAGIGSAPRGNGHEPALAHQFFTELRTDKAAATQNHDFFHRPDFARCGNPAGRSGQYWRCGAWLEVQTTTGSGSSMMPKRSYTLVWMARAKVITSPPVAPPRLTSTSACFS